MIDLERLNASLPALSEQFRTAKPFPHVVLEDVCHANELRNAVAHWPEDSAEWKTYQKSKRSIIPTEAHSAPLLPLLRVGSDSLWIAFLEAPTGFNGLILGDGFSGGGLAEVRAGGSLGMHVDFNEAKHETFGTIYRKLNCLLYLNLKWKHEWHGALELWNRHYEPQVVKCIEPVFNRMVIFRSSDRSWHGHPKELRCPKRIARRYCAFYYFVREKPKNHRQHSTVYAR